MMTMMMMMMMMIMMMMTETIHGFASRTYASQLTQQRCDGVAGVVNV